MANIAGRDVGTNDLGILATGVVALVIGFFNWFSVDLPDNLEALARSAGADTSISGYSSGFLAWFGVLLLIAAAALVAGRIFAGFALPTTSKAGPAAILLGISTFGAVLIVLRLLFAPDGFSRSAGVFLGVLIALAQAGFAYLAFKASGEAMPDFKNLGGSNGPSAGGTPPPPPPTGGGGYPPPPPPPTA